MHLLIIFAKEPKKGHVKTRLAQEIGEEAARTLYEAFLNDTVDLSRALSQCDVVLFYSPESNPQNIAAVLDEKLSYQKQIGKNLGARMANAFHWGFSKGYQRIIIIGTDCPLLTPTLIQKGLQSLQVHDIVLGPSQDGGYYLIGESSFHEEPFQNVTWSTASVLATTLQNLQHHNLSYHLLPTLFDIDTKKDLDQLNSLQKTHLKRYTC